MRWAATKLNIVGTDEIKMLKVVPSAVRMKLTRTSLSIRASRENLSYFSYATGTRSMNSDRRMPAIETKMANPVNPAVQQFQSAFGSFSPSLFKEVRYAHGPTFHLAWKDATPAKQHMARKLKNT